MTAAAPRGWRAGDSGEDETVRVVVVTGAGSAFTAVVRTVTGLPEPAGSRRRPCFTGG